MENDWELEMQFDDPPDLEADFEALDLAEKIDTARAQFVAMILTGAGEGSLDDELVSTRAFVAFVAWIESLYQ